MPYPEFFDSFMIHDMSKWSDFEKTSFKPRLFGNRDVDIKIECCGVCGSDVHKINGGFGPSPLPIAVGHEVIGRAVKVGSEVTTIKVGDRVGVGAQVWSCLNCPQCKSNNEQYCPHLVDTYGTIYPKEVDPEQPMAQGGYSSHIRAHEYFTFPIPDELPSHVAAPMLCAGLTVWSPMVRAGIGKGKKIAIIGLGGLGHFGVLFASALGAEVTVISHSQRKKEDAMKLGAHHFVVNDHENWAKPLAFKFDMVLNTADQTHKFDIPTYLGICAINGSFHQVGIPDEPLQPFKVPAMMVNGSSISASHIGNRSEMLSMLKFAAEKRLMPMIETIPISEEGCKEAVTQVYNGKGRYRYTLTGYDQAFGA